VRGPEEPHAVHAVAEHVERLFPQSLAIAAPGRGPQPLVAVREVARVRGRIRRELAGRRERAADRLHLRTELRRRLDVRRRGASPFAVRSECEVVALAPDRHRRAADDVVRPREPRHEQGRRRSRGGEAAQEPLAGRPATDERGDHDERSGEHEHRTDEREKGGERAGARPRREPAALPRAREDVDAAEEDRPRKRLREDERHVVLRPRVERVEQPGQERDALAPPAADREHEQPRAEPEEHGLADERGRVVSLHDRLPAERCEVERVPGRAKDLALGREPDRLRDARSGDVEPVREDVDEPGLQRRRVGAVAERVGGGLVRPAVGLLVRADERHVDQPVNARRHRQDERDATERHGGGL